MNPIIPDWSRVSRAEDKGVGRSVPADAVPVQNANESINKVAVTLNRAGSGLSNPVLLGLGVEIQFKLSVSDSLIGVWVYREVGDLGPNLKANVSLVAPGTYSFFLRSGSELLAGDHDGSAVRNLIRVESVRGKFEKEMWCKDYSAAVVRLANQNALDPADFSPVAYRVDQKDVSIDFIEIDIDYMADWADEFQVLHKRTDGDQETGFLKSYGGAKFVSFFDYDGDDTLEGVGVMVEPVTQERIEERHKVRVQNTVGTKDFVVRFRSKVDSDLFVDVRVQVIVQPNVECACLPPQVLPCVDLYLKHGALLPVGVPAVASTPGVQVVAGTPGVAIATDLLIVTIKGAIAGGQKKMRVQKWGYAVSAPALEGARTTQIGSDEVYLPLLGAAASPDPGGEYTDPNNLTIAFNPGQLSADGVAFLTVEVEDDGHFSIPVLILASRARDIMFIPTGGTGGGPTCAAY